MHCAMILNKHRKNMSATDKLCIRSACSIVFIISFICTFFIISVQANPIDIRETENFPIFTSEPLPKTIETLINGVSHKEVNGIKPPAFSDLAYLTLSYVNFEGEHCVGNMIVAAELGDEVVEIFMELYENSFPIYQMELIDVFDADDDKSMAANNSSAFNFRLIKGTKKISKHGLGIAIDINPVQNPYITGGRYSPPASKEYKDRNNTRQGMIIKGDVCYNAFISRGWTWGGHWNNKDYQHFEKN